jgi:hypothetical protein
MVILQNFFQAFASAESTDFDIALAPAGESGHFAYGAVFELAEGEDELLIGAELAEAEMEKLMGPASGGSVFSGVVWKLEHEIVEGKLVTVAAFLAQEVVAGGNGETGEPMLEGRVAPELCEVTKGAEKDFLGEVLELVWIAREPSRRGKNAPFMAANDFGKSILVAFKSGLDEGIIGWRGCFCHRAVSLAVRRRLG